MASQNLQPVTPVPPLIAAPADVPTHALAIQRAPALVLEEAHKAAEALMQVVESKPHKVVINGKTFLQYEDWQILGRFYGVTAAVRATTYLEQGRVRGYEARAEAILVSTNQVISGAEALCMDDEEKWARKPLYQLKSMAQTRACAKALRNVLAWVVVLAGYSGTPAEEMDGAGDRLSTAEHVAQRSSPAFNAGGAGRISRDRLAEMTGEISRASSYEQLDKAFRFAYREASTAGDQAAQSAYIAAKSRRRGELRTNGGRNSYSH